MHFIIHQSKDRLLNLRSLLCTTLGKAIDLPAYSCVETLVRALSHQDTETHSTKGFTAVPDNSTFYSSTTCIKIQVYTNTIHVISMSLIKYIARFLSIPHSFPGLPLRLPLTQPCQDNLSPISFSPLYQFPFHRTIRLSPCNHPVPHLTIRGPFPIRC